jgi:hypothetical protein
MRKVLPFVSLAALISSGMVQPTWSASPDDINSARANGLAWLVKNQKGDGSWFNKEALKVQSTSATIEALMNAGMRYGHAYSGGVAWLANAYAASIDAQARKIATLSLAGFDTTVLAQSLLAARPFADRQVWGAYPCYNTSFPDTPLGLAALRLSGYAYANKTADLANALACEVMAAQRSDGGWAYVKPAGTNEPATVGGSRLMPTAFTVLELKAQQTAMGWTSRTCGSTTYYFSTVLGNGVNFLLSRKNSDNGFGENGVSSPLETALAYLPIASVNSADSSLGPAQDYLITGTGKPAPDGSWGGDPFATAMVLKTLPAVTLTDSDGDGIPDVVETAMNSGSSTTVADNRNTATGNGQGKTGVNSALFVASATINVSFSHIVSGTAPYQLLSGNLPDGLSLASSGLISGTPTKLGSFNFTFADATGQTLGRIDVVPANIPGDLNGDGVVDVADVALMQRYVLGLITLSSDQLLSADLAPVGNPDGVVDMADLQLLVRMALGLQ